MAEDKFIDLAGAAQMLSISQATVRNWVRSGLLNPLEDMGEPLFRQGDVENLAADIAAKRINRLTSRRNKKYVPGNYLPRGYLLDERSRDWVRDLINMLTAETHEISENLKKLILAEYALKFYFHEKDSEIRGRDSSEKSEKKEKNTVDKSEDEDEVRKGETRIYLAEVYESVSRENLASKLEDEIDAESGKDRVPKKRAGEHDFIYEFVREFLTESGISREKLVELLARHKEIFQVDVFPMTEDVLGLLYMSLASLSARKGQGSYYTPTSLVRVMVDEIIGQHKQNLDMKLPSLNPASLNKTGPKLARVLDPACGTGNFLMELFARGQALDSLHGYDQDANSIFIARMNLLIVARETYEIEKSYPIVLANIRQVNSLELVGTGADFDLCIGNPPWGAEIGADQLEFLQSNYQLYQPKGLESFALFLELGMDIIRPGGYLSYVLPESFFVTASHTGARALLAGGSQMLSVSYWGSLFDGVQAPVISFLAERVTSSAAPTLDSRKSDKELTIDSTYPEGHQLSKSHRFGAGTRVRDEKGEFYSISSERQMSSALWTFNIRDEVQALLDQIENHPDNHFLAGQADFALGIVTGNNAHFIKDEQLSVDYQPIVRGSDISRFVLGKLSSYIHYQPDKFQQVARNDLYFAKEKILYRFVSDSLIMAYDDEERLSLNSANLFLPKIPALPIKYVLGLTNSRLLNFYYQQKFRSIKVLRSQLEALPLRDASPEVKAELVELVDEIIGISIRRSIIGGEKKNEDHNLDCDEVMIDDRERDEMLLYDKLNQLVYRIYGLGQVQIDLIEGNKK